MKFSAEMIAGLLGGTIEGNKEATVSDFAKIEEGRAGCISFLANPKYTHFLATTESTIVLISKDIPVEGEPKATLIRVDNAYDAIAKLLTIYESATKRKTGVSPLASVAASAKIGKDCYIAPFVAIGENVVIGDNTVIHPSVVIYDGCVIGSNCILHAGCVIGADGFGFVPTPEGYEKIPQIGIVTIEDNVELGANTCVDRSTMGSTYVRKGVKLDNLVQIAHNCDVGANTVMSSQVGVAGSTKIGEWCMFGGQVGIGGHAHIPNRTMAGAQAGIPNTLRKEGMAVQGSPAIDGKNFWRSSVIFKQLPELSATVHQMKKEIEELKKQLTNND